MATEYERFPKNWKIVPFTDAFSDQTVGQTKLKKDDYLEYGELPIIDQGQEFISGFTNNMQAKCDVNLPCILFGDHTKNFKFVTKPFVLGADGVKVLSETENINPKFAYYYLKTLDLPDVGYSRHFRFLKRTFFPIPPLEEQKRIAAILDKADRVRRKRQEAIRLTEELGRSIFIDMFGNLFAFLTGKQKHEKGFLYCKLGDQITLQRGFDLLKKDCTEGIYPVISSGGIHTYHDRYKAKGPGVLLGRKGSVGRVHYVEEDYWPHDTTLWIKDFNNNNQVFVYHFFRLFPILRFEASTASPTLNRNRLHPLQVFWPDRELQTKFANSISVINKYGDRNSFHFLQSENLFNSLLQRAFRGEL